MPNDPVPPPASGGTATINGRPVDIAAGETILQAARRTGQFIPTLCELADIDHAPGTCRICLVEITRAGEPPEATGATGATWARVVTACTTALEDGMQVRTRTREVREMQRLQVELLLADHDLDCATCVRHGSCELQDVAQFVGLTRSRFRDPALIASRPIDRSSPAMVRNMQRCVRCMRCVAICREGQGIDALVMTGYGHDRAVGLRNGVSQQQSDCITCGQCVMVCPTGALGERDDTETVIDYLYDPDIITVVQFAPAIRVGFGEEFGMAPGTNVEGRIIAAARALGADVVLDTNFAADVVVMEEATELLSRLGAGQRPTFSSCCPAWINFAEQSRPEILPHLSTTKSPQQVLGTIAKTYLPRAMGLDADRIRVVSVMPCTAKKEEITRDQLQIRAGTPEVDVVLTVREFARLLRREGVDFKALVPSAFDNPYMSEYSGAGAIFATTGGVMEAALRTVYWMVNGRELETVEIGQLRGFDGVRTARVHLNADLGDVKVAMCHGMVGTRQVVDAVLAGTADLDFIEVMACPGGCVDGGGTLRSKKSYLSHAMARRQTLYAIDGTRAVRQSHNNTQVQALYRDYLGSPCSDKAHRLLHTHYRPRPVDVPQTVAGIWKDIRMSTRSY